MIPPPGECHLWLAPVRPRAGWLRLLDPAERERADRLDGTPAGEVFVTSRGAQRLVGSRYLGVPPETVRTDRSCPHCVGAAHGRPRFVGPRGAGLDYSVSHTERWLLMAVTGGGLVGVDIEDLAAVPDAGGLARAALTPGERARWAGLPEAERDAWLLSAWTRKEAAMKLTGLGLRASPRGLDVSGPTVAADGVPRWPAGPVRLYSLSAPAGHVAALATTAPLGALRRFALPEAPAPRERVGRTTAECG
ncbi:4'-phosphopantetheinyl transferase family protein [Streptomyces radicis]|uniref:4'-phosphopantetheinyl transferase superfamily protein n=1 Tax=Streptomyces radicis TaxID=1750517 RepID=A0A3A9WBU0_9ACTN|nr:4'-phosphopantetheinyl transferase superfamily protein [Streptomyces radicis]RKN05096.1 4'-phosphopantetheinyl transferase superfamily protein [Streptomyces radicis]RKN16422.1 4'-phosphopantetheinyl transferase superfamily protein [Streptomyces radicis]